MKKKTLNKEDKAHFKRAKNLIFFTLVLMGKFLNLQGADHF